MQSKIVSKLTFLIVVLVGFALSLALIFHYIEQSSNSPTGRQVQSGSAPLVPNSIALTKQEQASFGLPARLKIPKINVDANVEHVSLTSSGAMDVPKDSLDVAWFDLGPRPGQNGSAVIDGHYGRKNGRGSTFDELYKLRKGDTIYIEDDNGVTVSFVVRDMRRYDPNADASGVFGSQDGKSHLNLITCEGIWDSVAKSFSQRLVVFTDKE